MRLVPDAVAQEAARAAAHFGNTTAAKNHDAQYIINDGQATAGSLNYAPLPDGVKQYDLQQINLLTAAGQPIQ